MDWAVYRNRSGEFDYCPQGLLLAGDLVLVRDLALAEAIQRCDEANLRRILGGKPRRVSRSGKLRVLSGRHG